MGRKTTSELQWLAKGSPARATVTAIGSRSLFSGTVTVGRCSESADSAREGLALGGCRTERLPLRLSESVRPNGCMGQLGRTGKAGALEAGAQAWRVPPVHLALAGGQSVMLMSGAGLVVSV